MNGGAVPQCAHLVSYTELLCNDGATPTSTPPPLLVEHSTPAPSTAAQGDELCNPPADKARFGEIWEAEIPLKLPVLLLWKLDGWESHGIGLGWI